jgi:hypothetical protein
LSLILNHAVVDSITSDGGKATFDRLFAAYGRPPYFLVAALAQPRSGPKGTPAIQSKLNHQTTPEVEPLGGQDAGKRKR